MIWSKNIPCQISELSPSEMEKMTDMMHQGKYEPAKSYTWVNLFCYQATRESCQAMVLIWITRVISADIRIRERYCFSLTFYAYGIGQINLLHWKKTSVNSAKIKLQVWWQWRFAWSRATSLQVAMRRDIKVGGICPANHLIPFSSSLIMFISIT